jgi:5'-nucleotidase
MDASPLILVTNDDGYEARGLEALALAFEHVGEVWMVAPDRERSGASHAITLTNPLRVRQAGPRRFVTDGTPTDCVFLAIQSLLPRRPALVVSGINHGPNLGDDVTYSGTVAGAMEGTIMGVPSIAVSVSARQPRDFMPAAHFAVAVARHVLAHGLPARSLLNVNVPDTDGAPVTRFRWARGGHRDYGHRVIEQQDPRGRAMYWIGSDIKHYPVEGGDCDAVEAGIAAITPLQLDLTHHALLEAWGHVELPGYDRV